MTLIRKPEELDNFLGVNDEQTAVMVYDTVPVPADYAGMGWPTEQDIKDFIERDTMEFTVFTDGSVGFQNDEESVPTFLQPSQVLDIIEAVKECEPKIVRNK